MSAKQCSICLKAKDTWIGGTAQPVDAQDVAPGVIGIRIRICSDCVSTISHKLKVKMIEKRPPVKEADTWEAWETSTYDSD